MKQLFGMIAVGALVAVAGCASPTSEDAEGTGESQDMLLAGRRLSQTEAASLIRAAGFPSSVVGKMLCTIKYESNFYERASNKNKNGSVDYGLFQINSVHFGDSGCPSSSSALYTASTNAKCAYQVYKAQGANAWYGYQKHRSECDRTPAPSTSSAKPPAGDDDSSADDSGSDTSADGGCYSGTLEDMVDAHACVESKFDGDWYQCSEGKWYRGATASSGPYGACSSSTSL